MSKHPLIEVQNLTHTYGEGAVFEKKALDDISLTIEAGECIGLIGHTGSGKSTLIQHLNALLRPTSGRVLIDGEDINADKRRLKAIRGKVGLVFQYPEHQLFEVNVYKDVSFGPANMGLPPEETDRRAKEALELVGLTPEVYDKSPFELSGGQKRRAAIAGVLAMRPEILILDEPTAGLDPRGRDAVLAQITQMHQALRNTVILVSHSMEDVARLADRILVMANGRLVRAGTPADIFADPDALEAVGLSAPPISLLMRQLRRKGVCVPDDIFTTEEAAQALAGAWSAAAL